MEEVRAVSTIGQTINYPFQVNSLIQDKQGVKKTLGIDAQLSVPDASSEQEKAMPLEMHSGFSRFVATLIQKDNNEKIFVKANIPARDVAYIYEKSKAAMSVIANMSVIDNDENLSLAYTERFTMGNYKGKTPAEILIENPNNKDKLIEQGKFLNGNISKFPANKKKIEAIRDAINLLKEGKLSGENVKSKSSSVITIYDEQMKSLRSTKDEKGRCLVYGIKIVCDSSRNLPFYVEIMNCYAPVKVDNIGRLQPQMKEAVNTQKIYMNITEKDWFKTVYAMNQALENFELIHFEFQEKIAEDAYFRNRERAKSVAN